MEGRGWQPIRRGSAGGALAGLALASLAGCHAPDAALPEERRFRGPVPSRNQHPLALTYPAFRPRRAVTQPAGSWGLALDTAYSSIFQNQISGPEAVLLDGELWTAGLRMRYGLTESSDLEVELPFVATSGGFLDEFVQGWHDFFGFPNGNRETQPNDEFAMRVSYAGAPIYTLEENHIGPTDSSIVWTRALLPQSDSLPALSLRAGVQLPTGSTTDGTSNGELDWGLGLLFERTWPRVDLTAGFEFLHVGGGHLSSTPIDQNDLWSGQLGAEYLWNRRISLLVQLVYTTPLLEDFEIDQIDREIIDLGFGAALDTSAGSRLVAAFHEDLVSQSGSDFAFALSWLWRL